MITFPILFILLHTGLVCGMTRLQRGLLCVNWILGIGGGLVGTWMHFFGPHQDAGFAIAMFFSVVGLWSNAFFLQNFNWPAEPVRIAHAK